MKIVRRDFPDELLQEILELVKKKKELSRVEDSLVQKEIVRAFEKEPKLIDKVLAKKKAPMQQIMKSVRAELRRLYGSYNDKFLVRNKIFSDYKKSPEEDLISDFFETHQSTKERMDSYDSLYSMIFRITGKPESILDLGCGMNPLSVSHMDVDKVRYFASDISGQDLEILQFYFDNDSRIDGSTKVIDLIEHKTKNVFDGLPSFDICFLFKVLEIIEQSKSHKISEKIIIDIPAKWVVVSFPTRTISGQKMNYPRRGWIERMANRLEFEFETIELGNEIFYIIKKH